MAHSVSSQRVDNPSTITSATQSQPTAENPAIEQASAATSNTPNLKSKPLQADQLVARNKTGLAKKLEESFTNQSVAATLANLSQTAGNTEDAVATPGNLEDIETADRTLRKRKLDTEYPSLKRRIISNPNSDSPRSPYRSQSTGKLAIHSVKKTAGDSIALDEQPVIPAPHSKVPVSPISPFSTIKDKVESLLSSGAQTGNPLRGIEWTSFYDSNATEEPDSFHRFNQETNSPPMSPGVGEKRKATDEINPDARAKRLRFSDDDLSRVFGSPIAQFQPKPNPSLDYKKEIDRLSNELAKDYQSEYEFMSKKTENSAVTADQKKSDTNPMNVGNLGESVRSARARNNVWFTTHADQSASIAAQTTLQLMLDANEKKINKSAGNSLQELFALIPAGAILGTEFFDYALTRAIHEISLNADQWKDIDDLYSQYQQLHVPSNPRGIVGFKELLGRIIAIKNSMLEGDNLLPTS